MPKNVLDKVWAYFDAAGPLTGAEWPIKYRWEEQRRLDLLRAMGVRAFPSLVYPHRPAMAGWLNAWAADFAARQPDVVHTATFFPEPSAAADVQDALVAGARLFKSHVQVGAYDPTWTWLLNNRAPATSASRTSAAALGSGKKVAVCTTSGWRAAKSAAQALSQPAIAGRCG